MTLTQLFPVVWLAFIILAILAIVAVIANAARAWRQYGQCGVGTRATPTWSWGVVIMPLLWLMVTMVALLWEGLGRVQRLTNTVSK